MGFDPANGGFAVVDLRWPALFGGQSIANRDAGVAFGLEEVRDATESAALGPVAPGPAVDVDQDGQWFVIGSLFWQRQVQCLPRIVGGCVGEVFEDPEVLGAGCSSILLSSATSHEVQVLLERDEVVFVLVLSKTIRKFSNFRGASRRILSQKLILFSTFQM